MKPVVLDLGANKGYTMLAFLEKHYDVWGIDILEDKSDIIDSPDNIVREHYILGSVCDMPKFPKKPDIIISINVFEHIPVNKVSKMAIGIEQLGAKYLVFVISKDIMSEGHITLKGTNWWVRKFPHYRLMRELKHSLNQERFSDNRLYQYSGIPRNGWNKVPGFIFLEKK